MAMIKCPECGKDISDKASSCPSCGCPLNVSDSKKTKTPIIVIAIATVLAICIIGGIFIVKNQKSKLPELDEKEQYALTCLEKIHSNLKNPESLQVHDIEWIDDTYNDDITRDYYYFDISAQNSMGGLTRDSYIFCGSNTWTYKNDVDGKDLNTEVPIGAIIGFGYQQDGKGEDLDVDKIMQVFEANK